MSQRKHFLPTIKQCLVSMAGYKWQLILRRPDGMYVFQRELRNGQLAIRGWRLGALRELYRQPDLFASSDIQLITDP